MRDVNRVESLNVSQYIPNYGLFGKMFQLVHNMKCPSTIWQPYVHFFCFSNFGWFIGDEILLYPLLFWNYLNMSTTWTSIFSTTILLRGSADVELLLYLFQRIWRIIYTFYDSKCHKHLNIWPPVVRSATQKIWRLIWSTSSIQKTRFFVAGGELCWAGRMLEVKTRGAQICS